MNALGQGHMKDSEGPSEGGERPEAGTVGRAKKGHHPHGMPRTLQGTPGSDLPSCSVGASAVKDKEGQGPKGPMLYDWQGSSFCHSTVTDTEGEGSATHVRSDTGNLSVKGYEGPSWWLRQ